MIRFLSRTVLMLIANTIGLVITSLILENFHIRLIGFIVSVGIFTLSSIILEPFILKLAIKYLPVLRGGIELVTTFVSLLLTTIFTDGLRITGISTWILASLTVWLVVVASGILLPFVIFKNTLNSRQND